MSLTHFEIGSASNCSPLVYDLLLASGGFNCILIRFHIKYHVRLVEFEWLMKLRKSI